MVMDFSEHLKDCVVRPMQEEGAEGVKDSVQAMKDYSLLREDLDNLLELTTWPDQEPPLKSVESKVKAAFTRQYNKEIVLPYSTGNVSKKKGAAASAAATGGLEDEEEEMLNDEGEADDDTVEADSMIKAKKPTASRAGKGRKADEETDTSKKGKGKGKRSKK